MSKCRWNLLLFVVLTTIPLVCGCGTDAEQVPTPTSAAPQNGTGSATSNDVVSQVLTSWESGDKEGAVQKLISIEWNGLTSGTPLLMSEQEITSLSRAERNRVTEEASRLAVASRRLSQHAISLGEGAQASGDNEQAKAYYEAVLNFGQTLANPDGLFAVKSVGNAIVTMANEKQSALK